MNAQGKPSVEQVFVAALHNPLQGLLQGVTTNPRTSPQKRNPLYQSGGARQSRSRSTPSSPVSHKTLRATNKRSTGSCRRGTGTKSFGGARYKPLPGFTAGRESKTLGIEDFKTFDNLIFHSASAPCSPARLQTGKQSAFSQPVEPPIHLSALCLNSPTQSPQKGAPHPRSSDNLGGLLPLVPGRVLQPEPNASSRLRPPVSSEVSPSHTDRKANSSGRQSERQDLLDQHSQCSSPGGPHHALSPMHASPLPLETTATRRTLCQPHQDSPMKRGLEASSGASDQHLSARQRAADATTARQLASPCKPHSLPSQLQQTNHQYLCRSDGIPQQQADAKEISSTYVSQAASRQSPARGAESKNCRVEDVPAGAQPGREQAHPPIDHTLSPQGQKGLGSIVALAKAGMERVKGLHVNEALWRQEPNPMQPLLGRPCLEEQAFEAGGERLRGRAHPWSRATLQAAAPSSCTLPSIAAGERARHAQAAALTVDTEQHMTGLPHSRTMLARPSGPLPLPQRPAVSQGEALAQRRAAEDEAVGSTCPPLLRDVLRCFPTQKEAFAFADRCNSSQPVQAPPDTLMSRMATATEAQPSAGTACASAQGHSSSTTQLGDGAPCKSSHLSLRPREAQHQSHHSCEQQQPSKPLPGRQDPAQQNANADFLGRFAAGQVLAARCSPGYASMQGQLEPGSSPPKASAAAASSEQAKQAARAMYRSALQALRLPDHHTRVLPAGGSLHAGCPNWQGVPPAGGKPVRMPRLPAPGVPGMRSARVPEHSAGDHRGDAMRPYGTVDRGAGPPGAEAAAAALLHEEPVKVFCVERQGRSGVYYRQFAAATYPSVWQQYRRTPMVQRHWYEVIREGRPCHLYFDLECPASCNPDLDMDGLVNCLLHHVDEALGQHFGLAVDYSCVHELESSTGTKHSRHLVVRIPGHAFINNHAMGRFVSQVVAAAGPELMVMQSQEEGMWERGSVVDAAVYSRNRHFRMVWSCKGGKAAVLVPTRRFATQEGCSKTAAEVFLDSLICRVQPSDVLLQMPNPLVSRTFKNNSCPEVSDGEHGVGGLRVTWKTDVQDGSLTASQQLELKLLAEQAVPFIEQVTSHRAGGQQAKARTLAFCGYQGTVAYSMIGPGSHFCENIGRFHQSNHVFFVVNFINGMFCQKCHDPDCCHFRSAWMPLPPPLRLSHQWGNSVQ